VAGLPVVNGGCESLMAQILEAATPQGGKRHGGQRSTRRLRGEDGEKPLKGGCPGAFQHETWLADSRNVSSRGRQPRTVGGVAARTHGRPRKRELASVVGTRWWSDPAKVAQAIQSGTVSAVTSGEDWPNSFARSVVAFETAETEACSYTAALSGAVGDEVGRKVGGGLVRERIEADMLRTRTTRA